MPDKEEDQRIRQMLDGILGASDALPAQGGIVIQGATTIIINTGGTSSNRVGDEAGRKISKEQARQLRGLVDRIACAERAKDPIFHEGRIWEALHQHMGVEHYMDIAMADFDVAEAWLVGWLSSV